MRREVLALVFVGFAAGLVAEAVAFDWDQPRLWLPDLVVGQATRTHADHLEVSVAVADGTLHLRVTPVSDPIDADIVDRIGALGGRVTVTQGILHAEVPCA